MSEKSWLNHPAIKDMDPRKLAIILDLVKETEGMPLNKTLPCLMKANAKLKAQDLSFSKEETSLIMEILTSDMSPEEKLKVNSLKSMMESKMKEKK